MASDLKIKNYKVYKMSLTTLSPIFIGSGDTLNKSSYFYMWNRYRRRHLLIEPSRSTSESDRC